MAPHALTKTQTEALTWLQAHGGEGVLCKRNRRYELVGTNRTFLAQGQKAGFAFSTWEALEAAGQIQFLDDRKRIKLTAPS